jgi:hypothetical protein
VNYSIIKIRHYGAAFFGNKYAVLLVSGTLHHYVLLKP